MATEINVLDGEKVAYEGIFDLGEFYSHLHDWFEARKFIVSEKEYKEKIKGDTKDINIEWSAAKDVDEYSEYKIYTIFELSRITDVEVEVDGEKKTMQKGKLKIEVTATIKLDKEDKWEVTPVLKFLKAFYEKYLYNQVLDKTKADAWKYGWAYLNETKAYLNLYRF
ncbi:MAG: hypothetical protein AABW84_00365 [Nanoarchaeota archaeon]